MLDSTISQPVSPRVSDEKEARKSCPRCSANMILIYAGTLVKCFQCNHEEEVLRPSVKQKANKLKGLLSSGTMVVYQYIGEHEHLRPMRAVIIFTGKRRKTESMHVYCPWCRQRMTGVKVNLKSSLGRLADGVKYVCPDKHAIGVNTELDGWM